jgi:class 3 adenylate cyclase/tetratricopeptide (TPR) repeat protein
MTCGSCGGENRAGRRFCSQCGNPLELTCPSCGTANDPGDRFCGSCGAALVADAVTPVRSASAPAAGPERRLVSILFADLVGFTTLSEQRDPEEVRELLSRYFDRCRTLIERYGGTVEKFIGDALMAVWGTPVAREDDAERAVRASLALTQAVSALGADAGMPDLKVRAGVLTGSAAVDLAAEGEGMVLGDAVNTASRLQSIAEPGTVLVDDVTRAATEAAIAYEDAGTHEVKGREQPIKTWTALRVVATVGGAGRTIGLEAPFVGREHDLGRIVEALEVARADGRAHLVPVVGEAGTGKSRLLWEFEKHVDGLSATVFWHRGRCLSYGEGVAYWALAEMIRARAGIFEEENPTAAREKLHASVERYLPDERERRLVEPRLAHLLGLEVRTAPDRADLFSGWRLFFERLAEVEPVVMVFEDLQWADSGLLDFIDYLLEWSAEFPIFILAIGRPELVEVRPGWKAFLELEPLADEHMAELLEGLVPGLPEELAGRILGRAEGVPLYAVETVRMLLDRGLLTQEGSRYVVSGEVEELDVPETLHALVAARLDGLDGGERSLLQAAAVLGQSFSAAGVAALADRQPGDVERLLHGLVAKQILILNDDRFSAERGQFAFVQGLLRTIAYGTLARRDRKAFHLAAARYLQETRGSEAGDIAEVLAAHLLDAARADPEAADVPQIRALARETLVEAGQRAASLALGREAQRSYDQAAELAEDDETRAELFEQAGRAAWLAGDSQAARERLDAAIEIYEAAGRKDAVAGASAVLADVFVTLDRLDDAVLLAERAVADLVEADVKRAAALHELARLYFLRDNLDEALTVTEEALAIVEPLQAWDNIAEALVTRGTTLIFLRRPEEGKALLERGLALAREHDLQRATVRAHNNLGVLMMSADRALEALEQFESGLAVARARGDRPWELVLLPGLVTALFVLGRWDEVAAICEPLMNQMSNDVALSEIFALFATLSAARGDLDAIGALVAPPASVESADTQVRNMVLVGQAAVAQAEGRPAEALPLYRGLLTVFDPQTRREAYIGAVEAAWALDDVATIEALIEHVEQLPPVEATPLMRGVAARFAGLLAAKRGDLDAAEERIDAAIALLRELGYKFELAKTLLDRGEILRDAGRFDEAAPFIDEARAISTELHAQPLLGRVPAGRPASAA